MFQMFCISLRCVTQSKAGKSAIICGLFFMLTTKHIRFHAPVSLVNAMTAFEVLRNGSAWNRFLISTKFIEQTF